MKLSSEEIDRRARDIYMAMDPTVSYAEAVKFAVEDADTERRPDAILLAAGADPATLDLHHRVRALIMAEAEKGNHLTYLEAVRLIERGKAKS